MGLPPSGDRWLRAAGGYGRQVATGDRWLRAAKRWIAIGKNNGASTAWRQVATGDRWLRAAGGYARQVATISPA
jgi:hypothetical protein